VQSGAFKGGAVACLAGSLRPADRAGGGILRARGRVGAQLLPLTDSHGWRGSRGPARRAATSPVRGWAAVAWRDAKSCHGAPHYGSPDSEQHAGVHELVEQRAPDAGHQTRAVHTPTEATGINARIVLKLRGSIKPRQA
jgi:hypothetical protein